MGLLRSFVAYNRRLSNACARRFSSTLTSEPYRVELRARIRADLADGARELLEVGGIDRPFLIPEDHRDFDFVCDGLDIESKDRCFEIYDHFIVQSIEEPIDRQYDLIYSKEVLEHVRDNRRALGSIFGSLRPGRSAHQYIPGKGHPYALALRMIGPEWQKRLIPILRPDSVEVSGYPAFFDHCSPRAMKRLFEETGFVDIRVRSFYRANDYFAFFFPAFLIVSLFENLCMHLGWSYFASGIVISGTKPAE